MTQNQTLEFIFLHISEQELLGVDAVHSEGASSAAEHPVRERYPEQASEEYADQVAPQRRGLIIRDVRNDCSTKSAQESAQKV